MRTLTATKARNDFFNLLDSVYLDNNMYQIEKSGIPVAIIIKPDFLKQLPTSSVMDFAGAWENLPISTSDLLSTLKQNRHRTTDRDDKIKRLLATTK